MTLSFAQAELIGIVLHSALLGVYLNLFYQSLPYNLNGKIRCYNDVLLTANILLLILILSHWVVQIVRSQRAFIGTEGLPGDPASLYYAYAADYLNLLKEALYVMQIFVGDCMMVYRVWIVWDTSYFIIIVPVLTVIAFIVSSIETLIEISHTSLGEDVFALAVGRWAIALFTTSVGTNLMTSGLIAYKVWSILHPVKSIMYGSKLTAIAQIIVESAALYTLMTILVLIGYSTKQTWQFIFLDMVSPIIGISFTLISVRANRLKSSSQGGCSSQELPTSNGVRVRVVQDIHAETIGLDTMNGRATERPSKYVDSEDGYSIGGHGKTRHFGEHSAREE